tara:strand:+ start:10783 stop:11337 length:555 start_codon:yes stop_codon:yes gene_type:complete
MTTTVITPPDEGPVSLQEAKSYLRLGHDGEDALVSSLLASAVSVVEEAVGLSLVARTLRRSFNDWPRELLWQREMRLRPGPVKTLLAVRVVDGSGDETLLAERFRLEDGRLNVSRGSGLPVIPEGGRAEIDFVSGFGAPADVPGDLKLAVQMVLEAAYTRRGEDVPSIPESAASIVSARREVRL